MFHYSSKDLQPMFGERVTWANGHDVDVVVLGAVCIFDQWPDAVTKFKKTKLIVTHVAVTWWLRQFYCKIHMALGWPLLPSCGGVLVLDFGTAAYGNNVLRGTSYYLSFYLYVVEQVFAIVMVVMLCSRLGFTPNPINRGLRLFIYSCLGLMLAEKYRNV
ncbi:hypothetical protein V6N13_089658 [Hibiscus sabdariffa]